MEQTEMEVFRVAAICSEEFTDAQIEQLFLNLTVSSSEEISEAVSIIRTYRPKVLQKIEATFLKK